MTSLITWTLGNSTPDAEANLAQIAQWWSSLAGQQVVWQQRPIPPSGNNEEINWGTQQPDESFVIQTPELRGITLYWRKIGSDEERNITAGQLSLDLFNQRLDLLPASGRSYQLRVTLPKIVYQTIKLDNPQWASSTQPNGDKILLLRDDAQRLEVQINVSASNLEVVKQKLA